jgi:hypothetical protein
MHGDGRLAAAITPVQAAARPARRRAVASLEEKQMPARHHVGFYGAAFGTGFLFNAVKRNGAPAVHTLK